MKLNKLSIGIVCAFASSCFGTALAADANFERINEGPDSLFLLKKTSGETVSYIFSGSLTDKYVVNDQYLSVDGRFVINTPKRRVSEDNSWEDADNLTFNLSSDFLGALIQNAKNDLVDIQVNRGHTLQIIGGKEISLGSVWLQRSKDADVQTVFAIKGNNNGEASLVTVNGDISNFGANPDSSNPDYKPEPGKISLSNTHLTVTGSIGEAGAGVDDSAVKFEKAHIDFSDGATLTVGKDLKGATLNEIGDSKAVIIVAGTMSGHFNLANSTVTAGNLVSEEMGSKVGTLQLNDSETGLTGDISLGKISGDGSVGLHDSDVKVESISDGKLDLIVRSRSAKMDVSDVADNASVTFVVGNEMNNGQEPVKDVVNSAFSNISGAAKTDITNFRVEEGSGNNLSSGATGTLNEEGVVTIQETQHTTVTTLGEIADLSMMMWRAEANDINLRLGELRDSVGNNGVWARTYGGKNEYGSSALENEFYSLQFGYDHQIGEGSTKSWIGGALSYTDGESQFTNGNGDNRTIALTGYGSWLFDNGSYVDLWGKFGTLKNEFDKRGGYSGSFDTEAVALGIEVGYRHELTQTFFIEPQIEGIYSHIFSQDYSAGNGIRVEQEGTDSFVMRAGFKLGANLPEDRGNVYLRASYLYDFDGKTQATFVGQQAKTYKSELDGWYEIGIGTNYKVGDNTNLYADFEYENGGSIDTPYRWNVGVRHTW